jgi:hypothetical protein
MSRKAAEPSVATDELLALDTRYSDTSISIIAEFIRMVSTT